MGQLWALAVGPAQSRGHLVQPSSDPDFWLLCPTTSVRARATRAKKNWGPALKSGASRLLTALEKVVRIALRLYLSLSFPLSIKHFLVRSNCVKTSPIQMCYCQSKIRYEQIFPCPPATKLCHQLIVFNFYSRAERCLSPLLAASLTPPSQARLQALQVFPLQQVNHHLEGQKLQRVNHCSRKKVFSSSQGRRLISVKE